MRGQKRALLSIFETAAKQNKGVVVLYTPLLKLPARKKNFLINTKQFFLALK